MKVNNSIKKIFLCVTIFVFIISWNGIAEATDSTETEKENSENSLTSTNSTISSEGTESSSNNQEAENVSQTENNAENTQQEEATTVSKPESVTTSNENKKNQSNKTTTATDTQKKSNNANLKMLGINPNDFTGFKSGTTTYNVTVSNDVEQVNVYATPQDSKATVSGTGNQKLSVGKNALEVIVKAENGTEKTYTINVTREEAKNATNTNSTTSSTAEDEIKDLVKLEIEGYSLSPKFSPNVYEYKVDVNKDVSKINVITKAKDENVKIEVAGNEELKDGENTVTILVYNEDTKQNSTYQITVNKSELNQENEVNMEPAIQKAKKIRIILIGIVILAVIGIVAFILIIKRRKFEDEEEDEKYEYEINNQEKIDLDNEEELFRRVNREKLTKIPKEPEKMQIKSERNELGKKRDIKQEDNEEFFRTYIPKD